MQPRAALALLCLPALLAEITVLGRDFSKQATYPIYNAFDVPASTLNETFSAIIIGANFTSNAICIPSTSIYAGRSLAGLAVHTQRRLLVMIDWIADARTLANCDSQREAIEVIEKKLIPFLEKKGIQTSGWLPLFADSTTELAYGTAGPYARTYDITDSLYLTKNGSLYILDLWRKSSFIEIPVRVVRGPWNALIYGAGFIAGHWTMFALNLLVLLYGVYRLIRILRLRHRAGFAFFDFSSNGSKMLRNSHSILKINGIIFQLISLFALHEKMYNPFLRFLSQFNWTLILWTFSGMHISWVRMAERIAPSRQLRVLYWMAVFTCISNPILTVFLAVFRGLRYRTIAVVVNYLFFIFVPVAFIIQGVLYLIIASRFLAVMRKNEVTFSIYRKLQLITYASFWVCFWITLLSAHAFIYISPVSQTPTGYHFLVLLFPICGLLNSLIIFSLPIGETEFIDSAAPEPMGTSQRYWFSSFVTSGGELKGTESNTFLAGSS